MKLYKATGPNGKITWHGAQHIAKEHGEIEKHEIPINRAGMIEFLDKQFEGVGEEAATKLVTSGRHLARDLPSMNAEETEGERDWIGFVRQADAPPTNVGLFFADTHVSAIDLVAGEYDCETKDVFVVRAFSKGPDDG